MDEVVNAINVDVIIAAWQAAGTIEAAVRSALDQTITTRVILVDDASTDGTADRVASFGKDRLSIFRCPTNGGPSVARNIALDHASAEWIAILDADDLFIPGRLALLIAAAGDADIVADDLLMIDEAEPYAPPRRLLGDAYGDLETVDLATFIESNIPVAGRERRELGFIKPIIRRSFIERHRLRYDPGMRLGEDYDFYARCLIHGANLRLVGPKGYVYVKRARSISGNHTPDDLMHLRDADTRLLERPDLSPRVRQALRHHRTSTDARLQWRRVIDAVKYRRPGVFLSAFLRSPRVSVYLVGQLWKQLIVRSRRRDRP